MKTTPSPSACVLFSCIVVFGPRILVGLITSRNVQEIKFGDNDTLSAITSSMVHADYLFLLTDVDGLYLSNPRKDPDAKFLEVVSSVAEARLEGRKPANSSRRHAFPLIHLFPTPCPTDYALPSPAPISPPTPRYPRDPTDSQIILHILTFLSARLFVPPLGVVRHDEPGTPQ